MRIYNHSPIILGGRQPIKAGQHPHLAEVFPHIAAPRYMVIQQIKRAIRSGKSIVVLGLPGVGKSRLFIKLDQELGITRNKYMYALRSNFADRLASKSGLVIMDDIRFHVPARALEFPDIPWPNEVVGSEIGQQAIAQAITQGKQLVFIEPPMEEDFLAQFGFEIFILPPASFEEFDTVFKQEQVNGRTLSFPARKQIYKITGGNFRLAHALFKLLKSQAFTLTGKLLSAQQLTQDEIALLTQAVENEHKYCLKAIQDQFIEDTWANGLIRFAFLPNNGSIKADRFWTHFCPEQQGAIVRLLHYGVLIVEKDEIKFRSPLVQQAFADFFDPTRWSSPFIVF